MIASWIERGPPIWYRGLKPPFCPPVPRAFASVWVARPAAGLAKHMGDDPLSKREVEVLRYGAGNRNREIADLLFIAVKVHLKHIMNKLGANDRTRSVMIAAWRGIIHL